jgi:hypothetical protein
MYQPTPPVWPPCADETALACNRLPRTLSEPTVAPPGRRCVDPEQRDPPGDSATPPRNSSSLWRSGVPIPVPMHAHGGRARATHPPLATDPDRRSSGHHPGGDWSSASILPVRLRHVRSLLRTSPHARHIHVESRSPTQLYTLGDFFAVWRATYPSVRIGARPFPVVYTPTDLLGHTAQGPGSIRLVVDGRPSAAGPRLVLNTLDYCAEFMTTRPCWPTASVDPWPPLLLHKYGVGHTIVLQYTSQAHPR